MSLFSQEKPRHPLKTNQGRPGSQGEIGNLRGDVASAFARLEASQDPETANIAFVAKTGNDTTGNGSFNQPFLTIQAAVDFAEALTTTPDHADPFTVGVLPGNYDENVVISKDGIGLHIVGLCDSSRQNVRINPTTGVPVTVTNATLASLATYNTSGTYSDLAAKAVPEAGPLRVALKGLSIYSDVTSENGIQALGVKGDDTADTTDFLGQGLLIEDCLYSSFTGSALFIKNAATLQLEETRSSVGETVIREVGFVFFYRCQFEGELNIEYDPSDADGWSSSSAFTVLETDCHHTRVAGAQSVVIGIGATWGPQGVYVDDNVTVNDTGAIDGADLTIKGDLDVNGASGAVTLLNTTILGDVDVTVGKTMTLHNPHIGGAITLDNGAGAVVFNGGQYMGALTDVGGRLTFNLGTIGI